MDVLSLIGLLLAFVAIVGGNFLEGGHISALLNGPAALIVLGGTLGAVLLQTPIAVFMRAMSIGRWIFFPPRIDLARGILMVTTWSNTARKEGLLGLEPVAETEPDPYARKGLQLLVDGAEPEVIRSILEVDLYTQEGRDLREGLARLQSELFQGSLGLGVVLGVKDAFGLPRSHLVGPGGDHGRLGVAQRRAHPAHGPRRGLQGNDESLDLADLGHKSSPGARARRPAL